MDKLISAFPQNIVDALEIAKNASFKKPTHEIQHVVICGMGGSGIGGKLVAQWVENEIRVPILFAQDYTLPHFVNQHTLVIGSSYSGNTEETLSTINEAHAKGAHIIGICSGGEVAAFCARNNYDCVKVPGGNPPRSAVAFSVIQIVNLFEKLGFIAPTSLQEIEVGRQLIIAEENSIKEEAKKLAAFLKDKVIVIYSASNYESVAVRARQQFNENGKLLCWHHVIPEMNHNELVGWGGGDNRFGALFLQTNDFNPRNEKRLEFSLDIIRKKTDFVYQLEAKGATQIQRSIYLIHMVDWASWYLSELKAVDAMDIIVIDSLKDTLSKF